MCRTVLIGFAEQSFVLCSITTCMSTELKDAVRARLWCNVQDWVSCCSGCMWLAQLKLTEEVSWSIHSMFLHLLALSDLLFGI